MQALLESLFGLFFVIASLFLGYSMFNKSNANMTKIYAPISFVLGIGVGLFLIIRSITIWVKGTLEIGMLLGVSQLLSEIAMTAFVFALFYLVTTRYKVNRNTLNYTVYALLALRIILLLLPQNLWFALERNWALVVFRILLLVLVGGLNIMLNYVFLQKYNDPTYSKFYILVAIFLVCYVLYEVLLYKPYITLLIILSILPIEYMLYTDFQHYVRKKR